MAIKPILFNSEMVQAILAGQKTATRRVIKPQPKMRLNYILAGYGAGTWQYPPKAICEANGWVEEYHKLSNVDKCQNWTPPCHADDILYVREAWNYGYIETSDAELSREAWFEELRLGEKILGQGDFYYKADKPDLSWSEIAMKWRPSIHMPKVAVRIFLRVANVRVERLQDIDEAGAKAEGANCKSGKNIGVEEKMRCCAVDRFAALWDSTIKPKDSNLFGWDANPWVWRIEFERCEKPEEDMR